MFDVCKQDRAYRKIRDDVMNYYATNKATMGAKDLYQLISFAHLQIKILAKFNVDIGILSDLASDLLKQLSITAQVCYSFD